MRTPSDNLWELVHSLNPGEFKIFLNHAKNISFDKELIQVTKIIRTQISYDEKAALKTIKNPSIINSFSVYKSKIYNQVINSVSLAANTKEIEIYILLNKIKLLLDKNLVHHSIKF